MHERRQRRTVVRAVAHRVDVEVGAIRDGHCPLCAEQPVVLERDESRIARRQRFPDPVIDAVDIDAQKIDLTRESLLGNERIDTLARQDAGAWRSPGAREAHDDFPDRIIAPIHHQTVPSDLAREETGVAAIHPASQVHESPARYADALEDRQHQPVFVVLRRETESLRLQIVGRLSATPSRYSLRTSEGTRSTFCLRSLIARSMRSKRRTRSRMAAAVAAAC